MLAVNSAWAQEMPPVDLGEKKYHNMDSRLAAMYEKMLAGDGSGASDSAVPLNSGPERVQVILEMASADAPIPENLGIEVETSYEHLVQATVPVRNLDAIASDENVLRISLPSAPVPAVESPSALVTAMVQPLTEDGISPDGFDFTYVLIPAIVLPAIVTVFVWKRVSRK